jgi:hypothetical protein
MLDIAGRCKIVLRQKDYAAYTAPESEDYAFVFSAESAESRKMHFHVFGAFSALGARDFLIPVGKNGHHRQRTAACRKTI